jgi:hypothetical protein
MLLLTRDGLGLAWLALSQSPYINPKANVISSYRQWAGILISFGGIGNLQEVA